MKLISTRPVQYWFIKTWSTEFIYKWTAVSGAPLWGRLLTLPTNTRLGWKVLPGTNTLAYYGNPQITAVISFKIQAPGPASWCQTRLKLALAKDKHSSLFCLRANDKEKIVLEIDTMKAEERRREDLEQRKAAVFESSPVVNFIKLFYLCRSGKIS